MLIGIGMIILYMMVGFAFGLVTVINKKWMVDSPPPGLYVLASLFIWPMILFGFICYIFMSTTNSVIDKLGPKWNDFIHEITGLSRDDDD